MMDESLETDADYYTQGMGDPAPGIRRVGPRAEIDTSMPFESVKEAVTRFGGSGPWLPLYKLGQAYNSIEDFDIKKIEEQAAKLEKDLIMKELETLDVLEELGSAKTILEKLKQQLQSEALKCSATQDVNSYKQVGAPIEKHVNIVHNQQQIFQNPSHSSTLPSDKFLVELKQAKMNLGKTINDLGEIQSSVKSLNKKMKKERHFLERTRENLASKFAAISTQNVAQKEERSKLPPAPVENNFTFQNPQNVVSSFKFDAGQYTGTVETRCSEVSKQVPEHVENGFSIKTAEMRLFAAKKMEEAAMAAEAVALAEIKALSVSSADISSRFPVPEHQKLTSMLVNHSPPNLEVQIPEESTLKKVIDTKLPIDEVSTSTKLSILKKLEEATEEVLHSKKVLAEALNSIENANRKQLAAEEALRKWIPENDIKGVVADNSIKRNKFNRGRNFEKLEPVMRTSVSMRDVLSRKQVPEEYNVTMEMEEHGETKVALSQMLRALREDRTLPTIHEADGRDQKQFTAQRKKFGFIHISLPSRKRNSRRE